MQSYPDDAPREDGSGFCLVKNAGICSTGAQEVTLAVAWRGVAWRGAEGSSSSVGTRASTSRERLKRTQKSMKAEGSESAASQSSLSKETVTTMTEVKVKTEVPDDYIQEVIWQDDAKDSKKNLKEGAGEVPAEICVVIGGVRNQQTLGSYECGICGKKYKYYNCFQTHVRAHRGNGLLFYACTLSGA
ncbi:hypothetical protein JD844_005107 [Phrynosoma platyrhinos]|uniref:C2H2-type domain-containing protein n=1 Tax=Phrynosoma platyrhinos TaxID=52577 RepID=A0ABQ7SE67_PHRPL|nr:hypothetical protein JD844_005107 [Phrynosoma platyrhinos]